MHGVEASGTIGLETSYHKMSPLVMAVSCSPFLMRRDHCDSLILLDEDGLPESRRQDHATLLGEDRLGNGISGTLLNRKSVARALLEVRHDQLPSPNSRPPPAHPARSQPSIAPSLTRGNGAGPASL